LSFNTGPTYQSQASQLAQVQAEGGFELKSRLFADPAAYSKAIGQYLLEWRNTSQDGFQNKLDYIQALLRGSGMSSDDTPRGVFGVKDTQALKDASLIALQNGIPFVQVLEELYKTKGAAGGAAKFSKQVATSIRLLDPTDAKASLSDAYYQAFGAFPSEAQIGNYMNLYNAEAKRQKGKSVTTSSTSGTVTTSNTITSDQGFTQGEQQQFLADYLSKNLNVKSSADLGGMAKTLYDTIVASYKGNYQAEPEFATVMGVIKNVIGSADDKTAGQQLDVFLQEGRKIAAKQFLGLANELTAGEDVIKYSAPLAKAATKTLGVNISADDPLIKKALNFKDDKGQYRLMNDLEFAQAVEADPRYAVSSGAINKATTLASSLATKLGL
jgi:hypothetical protein